MVKEVKAQCLKGQPCEGRDGWLILATEVRLVSLIHPEHVCLRVKLYTHTDCSWSMEIESILFEQQHIGSSIS